MLLMTRSIFFFLLDDVMMSGSFFQTHFTINKPYEKALTIKKKKTYSRTPLFFIFFV